MHVFKRLFTYENEVLLFFVTHACTFYSLSHALAVLVMPMFRAWSPSTHVARYFTHLLHIGLLGLFPSTASLDAVCSVFHVLAAPLPSQSYCFMCSKSEANATNSGVFERAGGGDLARCRQPRKAKQRKTFTLIAICRI